MVPYDVLIAGAGPAGLALACDLLRRGLRVRVIDEAAGPSEGTRAVLLQPRSLEHLGRLGALRAVLDAGRVLAGLTVFVKGEPAGGAEGSELEGSTGNMLAVSQSDTEAALRATLEAKGGRVEWGTRLVSFRQHGTGVRVELLRGEAAESLDVAWLVGTDGVDGVVRSKLELDLESERDEEDVLIADVQVTWDVRDDRVSVFVDDDGLVTSIPMSGGVTRLVATIPAEAKARDADPTVDDLRSLLALRTAKNATLGEARWIRRMRTSPRRARGFRDDRVFVAGDAARNHALSASLGINAALHDALNLGWKLAFVHRGLARDRLLSTYDEERRGAAERRQRGLDAALRAINLKVSAPRGARTELAHVLAAFDVLQARIAKDSVDASIFCESSSLTREDKTGLMHARIGTVTGGDTPTLGTIREFASAPAAGTFAPDGRITFAGRPNTHHLWSELDPQKLGVLLFDGRSHSAEGYARLASIAATLRASFREAVDAWVVTPRASRPGEFDDSIPVILDTNAELEKRFGAQTECVYVLRPDGLILYRSQPADEAKLVQHLRTILRRNT